MKYYFFNTFVNILNQDEFLDCIEKSLIKPNSTTTFFYLNSYSFYLANRNKEFYPSFDGADYINADGYSIVFILKWKYGIDIRKVGITYFFKDKLLQYFLSHHTKLYFLGATESILEKVAKNFKINCPGLNLVGFRNGYFDEIKETNLIIQNINNANPDVLIVGMGMPRAEIWINKNKTKIKAKCIISAGGFFDFLAEERKMAPSYFYNSGMEWIYRLIQEPRRLGIRYIKANSYFIFKALKLIFSNAKG